MGLFLALVVPGLLLGLYVFFGAHLGPLWLAGAAVILRPSGLLWLPLVFLVFLGLL